MQELIVDLITSLDGYASAEGWPGWWGLEGPEYLAWLDEQPERDHTVLMGANTYRLMYGFAAAADASQADETSGDEGAVMAELTAASKVVFSTTLDAPLSWANTQLVRGDAAEAVAAMKRDATRSMRTIGSLSLCRSLIEAGLVDRFRVVVFPVITGSTGRERICDGYPDVSLDMITSQTFDGRIQLLEYVPTVLTGPPGAHADSDQVAPGGAASEPKEDSASTTGAGRGGRSGHQPHRSCPEHAAQVRRIDHAHRTALGEHDRPLR